MKLLINADDFGLSEGVTYGIYDTMKRGVVTSTTMIVNAKASSLAGEIVKRDKTISVGLHLNLGLGRPLTTAGSLTINGVFVKPKISNIHEDFKDEDLDEEFDAQYEAFCSLTGKEPTHLDSHLYTHQIYDNVRRATIRLADKHKLPVRDCGTGFYKAAGFDGSFKATGCDENELRQKFYDVIRGNGNEDFVLEMIAHPGFLDDYILHNSSYGVQRTLEHKVLTSESIKRLIADNKIELIDFKRFKEISEGR